MAKRKIFSGKSEGQAVLEAAEYYGLEPEKLAFRRLDSGLRRGRHVIEVDPEAPERDKAAAVEPLEIGAPMGEAAVEAEAPAGKAAAPGTEAKAETEAALDPDPEIAVVEKKARPVRKRRAARRAEPEQEPEQEPEREDDRRPAAAAEADSRPDLEAFKARAYRAVQDVLELAQVRLDAKVEVSEDGLDVDLFGPDKDRVWEDRGELLRALEHLLPRILREDWGTTIPCRVDSQGYRKKRRQELEEMAEEAAEEAVESGETVRLEAMSPAERRIIHLTLADDPDVETVSEGRGYLKRVAIRLV